MAERWEPPFERGQILVERRAEQKKYGHPMYECTCKICGKKYIWLPTYIVKYEKNGCPECMKKTAAEIRDAKKIEEWKNEIGKKYGNLTIVDFAGKKEPAKGYASIPYMRCLCGKCGHYAEIPLPRLRIGGAKECATCAKKNLEEGRKIMHELYQADGSSLSNVKEDRKRNKNNTTGFTGVSYVAKNEKYRAYIMFRRKQYSLGLYDTRIEAHEAYLAAKKRLHGGFVEWYKETYPEKWEKINKKEKKQKNTY